MTRLPVGPANLAANKITSHLTGRRPISGDTETASAGVDLTAVHLLVKQPEKGRQCGFGMPPERLLVRSSTLKGGTLNTSIAYEGAIMAQSGGIDFGERRSRKHPDQRLLGFIW